MNLILFYLILIPILSLAISDLKRVCYLRVDGQLRPSSLNGDLCTHIILGFASVAQSMIKATRSNDTVYYREAIAMKQKYPYIKVMLSIGGGGNENGFHEAAYTHVNRKRFADSIVSLISLFGFDGIDFDWEFPSWANFHGMDRIRFNLMIKQVRNTFDDFQVLSGRSEKLLISAAVSASLLIIQRSYSIPDLVEYVDFLNLMTYDLNLFKWYTPFVAHNSPLFKRSTELGLFATTNTAWAANYWHINGAPKDKLVIGIPTYARSFRLASKRLTRPGSPAIADLGDRTFSQVCDFLQEPGTVSAFDSEAKVPYAYNGDIWVSYEDEKSVMHKLDWITTNEFAGVMTFSLNADDHQFKCQKEKSFVLHSLINDRLNIRV